MVKYLLIIFLIQSLSFIIVSSQNECTFTEKEVYYVDVPITFTETVHVTSMCTFKGFLGIKKTKLCLVPNSQINVRYEKQRKIRQYERKKCCDGYYQLHGVCVPHCDKFCVNSKCTAPNSCTCNNGYSKDSDFHCQPDCKKCENGVCILPELCLCNPGYTSMNSTCVPVCFPSCENSICVSPNQCQCNAGYIMSPDNPNKCIPQCDNCTNGICRSPNVCECNKNFEKAIDSTGKFIGCDPICDPPCMNGNCISNGKINECHCFNGYEEVSHNECIPKCYPPCGGLTTCVAPNTCGCNSGYETFVENGTMKCKAICQVPCVNGFCSAPDECTCDLGFGPFNYTHCSTRCTPECENSFCNPDHECQCYPGYKKGPTLFKCVPECDPDCGTGSECVEPNRCKCLNGFIPIEGTSTECSPICTTPFENGRCIWPDQWQCKDGYRPLNATRCEPICEPECENGICVGPNKCECKDNYEMYESHLCLPHCNPPCKNGYCTIPGYCDCIHGYSRIDNTTCEPICNPDCVNGMCVKPNICDCLENYVKGDNQNECIPHCDEPCNNGFCTTNFTCQCNNGFHPRDNNSNYCDPICDPPCNNGICVEPNTCECDEGYTHHQPTNWSICVPYCDDECINGYCVAPDQCQCNEGYDNVMENSSYCVINQSKFVEQVESKMVYYWIIVVLVAGVLTVFLIAYYIVYVNKAKSYKPSEESSYTSPTFADLCSDELMFDGDFIDIQ